MTGNSNLSISSGKGTVAKLFFRALSWPFIVLIKIYQGMISPHFPGCCHFTPSCSSYAVGALRKHGVIQGLRLTVQRLVKCRPGRPGGYDPVP